MFFITEDVKDGEPALMKLHQNNFSVHIEHPNRLTTIEDAAKELKLEWIPYNSKATLEQIQAVHTKEYLDILAKTEHLSEEELREYPTKYGFQDVYFNNYTYQAALRAAGCGIQAVEEVLRRGKIGFAGLRPPGHHAMPEEASGFCYLNNIAIAAKHLVNNHPNIQRVLIVDWDVHCGQGTLDAIAGDDRIRLVNIFRHENGTFWPYCERSRIKATESKHKNTINVTLNSVGCGNWDYMTIMALTVNPLIIDWKPDFILVSCGYDSEYGDPEGDMKLTPLGFAHLARSLSTVQLDGKKIPLALFFEGGYFLDIMGKNFMRMCEALENDEQLPRLESHPLSPDLPEIIHRVHEAHKDAYPHYGHLYNLVERFKTLPPMEEVDKFIGYKPDIVEKDPCVLRGEEYIAEIRRYIMEIQKKENPSEEQRKKGGPKERDPPKVYIVISEEKKISFEENEWEIVFKAPESLANLLISTVLLAINPSSVPPSSTILPGESDISLLADFINNHREHSLFKDLPIMQICEKK